MLVTFGIVEVKQYMETVTSYICLESTHRCGHFKLGKNTKIAKISGKNCWLKKYMTNKGLKQHMPIWSPMYPLEGGSKSFKKSMFGSFDSILAFFWNLQSKINMPIGISTNKSSKFQTFSFVKKSFVGWSVLSLYFKLNQWYLSPSVLASHLWLHFHNIYFSAFSKIYVNHTLLMW